MRRRPRKARLAVATAWIAAFAAFAVVGGSAVEAQDEELDRHLWEAVDTFMSSEGEVTRLVEAGANPDARGDDQATPLMLAAIRGNERGVSELLAAGASVDAATTGGTTALMLASRDDEPRVTEILLEKGAAPDARDADGWTAPMYAAYNNAWQVIDLFIERGLALDLSTPDGWTAQLLAADKGHSSLMERLLEAGVVLPAMSPEGLPTLVRAAAGGDRVVVQRVLEQHGDLEVRGPRGETALMTAVEGGNTEVVFELIRKGAKVDAEDAAGRTALDRARDGGDPELIALLGGPFEPHAPPAGASVLTLSCEKLGGDVRLAAIPTGGTLELSAYYPRTLGALLGGFDICAIDPAKREDCGFKRYSADASFFLDLDGNPKTGAGREMGDPEVAAGSEYAVAFTEIRTSVQAEDGRVVSRQVMDAGITREGEYLTSDELDGYSPFAERDLNRLSIAVPYSALGLRAGQKVRIGGAIDLCDSGEWELTLK